MPMMETMIQAPLFLQRVFTPAAAGLGSEAGRELGGRWRAAIEYRLAELGYALCPEVRIRGLPSLPDAPPGYALYRDGALVLAGSVVEKGRFTEEFLALDLPYLLIDL